MGGYVRGTPSTAAPPGRTPVIGGSDVTRTRRRRPGNRSRAEGVRPKTAGRLLSQAVPLGLHHITALAGPAQPSVDFYAGLLGLRLVKLTVNFDAPSVYHLYYADDAARPGSVLTFFPFPDAVPGRAGPGETV